jgi:hypothetical protein
MTPLNAVTRSSGYASSSATCPNRPRWRARALIGGGKRSYEPPEEVKCSRGHPVRMRPEPFRRSRLRFPQKYGADRPFWVIRAKATAPHARGGIDAYRR